MRFIAFLVSPFALLVLLSGCRESSISPEGSVGSQFADTVFANISPGVTLTLRGLKDTYSLDDFIQGFLILKNEGDTSGFYLHFENSPPNNFVIFPVGSLDWVSFYPEALTFQEWFDTLRIGDSLCYPSAWGQQSWNYKPPVWTSLKAYSGSYRFLAYLNGNRLLRDMTKFFTITEIGEPLSIWLSVDYSSTDSLKADIIVRNRISTWVLLETVDPTPISLSFVHYQDTILSLSYPLEPPSTNVSPKSDIVLFRFRFAKGDAVLAPMNGSFDMRVTLRLKGRQLTSSGLRVLQ